MTRDRAGQPWRARQREILSRIVRETEAPTDSLPLIKHPERRPPDDYYDARLGEVLDLAVSVGAVLMASGTPATAVIDQVTAIAAAYGIEHCEVDVINTAIHVAVYRGPTLPPASTLHIVQSRSTDFSRLAAVDRLIRRIRAQQVSPSERPRRAGRHHHRAASVQALDRHPGLGCTGIRYRGDARRTATGLFGQRGEHHGD